MELLRKIPFAWKFDEEKLWNDLLEKMEKFVKDKVKDVFDSTLKFVGGHTKDQVRFLIAVHLILNRIAREIDKFAEEYREYFEKYFDKLTGVPNDG